MHIVWYMLWLSKYPEVVTESETSVPLLCIERLLKYLGNRKELQSLFIEHRIPHQNIEVYIYGKIMKWNNGI